MKKVLLLVLCLFITLGCSHKCDKCDCSKKIDCPKVEPKCPDIQPPCKPEPKCPTDKCCPKEVGALRVISGKVESVRFEPIINRFSVKLTNELLHTHQANAANIEILVNGQEVTPKQLVEWYAAADNVSVAVHEVPATRILRKAHFTGTSKR